MLFVCHRHFVAAAVLLLFCSEQSHASTITTAPKATSTLESPATCEFRTINYITDSLPQQCLRSSWSHSNATSATSAKADAPVSSEGVESATTSSDAASLGHDAQSTASREIISGEATFSISSTAPTASDNADEAATDLETGELNEASFLSFEEWKKQTLEKAGQVDANIGKRKSESKKRDAESIHNNLDSLGEDGEIDLDFIAFRSGRKGEEAVETPETEAVARQEAQELEDVARRKDLYRYKDAGITCKERFSYASFDAGATILKTHPGAKNPKAVLIENKDSYMLSECSSENKFIIVELSEDIWIDTVVLANYEFFSSMIRTFRVSVSDKYPVKIDKWKDIGTYEARNSREIQAFLIENPQIWARYIRIEFLSHYGNEYYCPLSLVRVHGQRMLESWKETEARNDEDEVDEIDGPEEHFIPEAVADIVKEEERLNAELKNAQAALEELNKTTEQISTDSSESTAASIASVVELTTPWEQPGFHLWNPTDIIPHQEICLLTEAPSKPVLTETTIAQDAKSMVESSEVASTSTVSVATNTTSSPTISVTSQLEKSISVENATVSEHSSTTTSAADTTVPASEIPTSSSSSIASIASKPQNVTSSQKNKTTSTSSASSSLPTIQESFFKAVSRRLQLLETNSTLSLGYIEQQSKILREAFSKVEKKQLQKTSTFLDTLNSTVFDELRSFRQQYDEIWQSTVISLESQRDESRREILAISTRLNILADEVIFQKRMSIVQSILLLLCLGLVIFSRVSAGGNIDFQSLHSRARNFSGYPVESPLASPHERTEYPRTDSMQEERWLEPGHRRERSDDTAISRSRSREDSPPTSISTYPRSEENATLTPPSGGDINAENTGDIVSPSEEADAHLHSRPSKSTSSSYHPVTPDDHLSSSPPTDDQSLPQLLSSSPLRTPKKRKTSIRQQASPPPSGPVDSFNSSFTSTSTSTDSASDSPPHLPPRHETFAPSPPRLPPRHQDPEQDHLEHDSVLSPSPDSPSHEGSTREKRGFGIARKPLPALPTG